MKITISTGLEKPAVALIEALSSAAGVLYEPKRIRKKAVAEAHATVEVNKILALGEIDNKDLIERAANRFIEKAVHQQENIEAVIENAIPLLEDKAKPENIDKDWLNRFVDGAEKVSNDDARKLWSKILSGDANKPGSYSIRTINTLALVGPSEANMIRDLANLTLIAAHEFTLVIPNTFYEKEQISDMTYDNLIELESLGLVTTNFVSGYSKAYVGEEAEMPILMHMDDNADYLLAMDDVSSFEKLQQHDKELEIRISVGNTTLTQVGQQIITLVEDKDLSKLLYWLDSEDNNLNWKLQRVNKSTI